jgi:hypothetical protein
MKASSVFSKAVPDRQLKGILSFSLNIMNSAVGGELE